MKFTPRKSTYIQGGVLHAIPAPVNAPKVAGFVGMSTRENAEFQAYRAELLKTPEKPLTWADFPKMPNPVILYPTTPTKPPCDVQQQPVAAGSDERQEGVYYVGGVACSSHERAWVNGAWWYFFTHEADRQDAHQTWANIQFARPFTAKERARYEPSPQPAAPPEWIPWGIGECSAVDGRIYQFKYGTGVVSEFEWDAHAVRANWPCSHITHYRLIP